MIVGQIIGVNNSAQNHQHIFSNITIVHAVAGVYTSILLGSFTLNDSECERVLRNLILYVTKARANIKKKYSLASSLWFSVN